MCLHSAQTRRGEETREECCARVKAYSTNGALLFRFNRIPKQYSINSLPVTWGRITSLAVEGDVLFGLKY